MKKIGLFYGSTTGNAENVANIIADKIGREKVEIFNVADIDIAELQNFDNLILGTSTWGFGDLQDDREVLLTDLEELDLSGKNVALFAVGNSQSNSDSFCGSMSHLNNAIKENGPKIIEGVSVEGYSFDESDSVIDGMFVGLAIDEDNESDLTESRVDNWLKKVLPNFS